MKILKPFTFVVANFFTIIFIIGLVVFFFTPSGEKVAIYTKETVKGSIENLPRKIKRAIVPKTYAEKAQDFVACNVKSVGDGAAKATHLISYYFGVFVVFGLIGFFIYWYIKW